MKNTNNYYWFYMQKCIKNFIQNYINWMNSLLKKSTSKQYHLLYIVSVSIITVDQITKYFIHNYVEYTSFFNVTHFFNITYVRNFGITFGLLGQFNLHKILIFAPLLIVFYLIKLYEKSTKIDTRKLCQDDDTEGMNCADELLDEANEKINEDKAKKKCDYENKCKKANYDSAAQIAYAQIAYSLVIGGAIGNVLDRVFYGFVIDFLDFYLQEEYAFEIIDFFNKIYSNFGDFCFGNFISEDFAIHWPAFNVADIAICIGALMLLYCEARKDS